MAEAVKKYLTKEPQPFLELQNYENETKSGKKIYLNVKQIIGACLSFSAIIHNYPDSTIELIKLLSSLW